MKTRKILVILALLLGTVLSAQETKKNRFYTEFDLYTGLKAGICRQFNNRFALYSSMGIALAAPTQISYNLFAAYTFMNARDKFKLDLNAGFIHGVFDIIGPSLFPDDPYYDYYFYVNPGLALHGSLPLGEKIRMGLRLGAEIMIGYEENAEAWTVHPEPEPNAALTLLF